MGGSNTTNRQPRIASLSIQSSAYGISIPFGAGRARLAFNLGWANGFVSEQVKKTQSGGKGGGSNTSISYKYFIDLIFFICDTASGPIRGINAIYRDKSVYSGADAVVQAGFAGVALGASGQPVWDYLEQTYPAEALGYDTLAYVYGSHYQLNDQAGLQNHSAEVDFHNYAGGSLVDANPGDYAGRSGIITEFLTSQIPQWLSAYIGDLSDYGAHCLAMNLLLSPCLDSQVQASSFVDEVMSATNSMCWVRGDGTFLVKPLTDASATGNGVTWTPDLSPVYDLTDADFIVDSRGDDPIKIDTENLDDIYNLCQLTYKNRQHQYNDETVSRPDPASISQYGQRKRDPESIPSIKDPTVAALALQLMTQRYANLTPSFTFMLPPIFARLEEMDLVTLTNAAQGLERTLVRIKQIDRDPDTRKRTIKATKVLIGTANAPIYGTQLAQGGSINFDAAPGDIATPALLIPPLTITNGQLQVWGAVGSTNPNWGGCEVWISLGDADYVFIGRIDGGDRYGATVNELPVGADPDTADLLTVDLSESAGTLLSASQSDADSMVTLCWVGGELVAYRDAALVGTNQYRLGYLRRGVYNTPVQDHPAGTSFVRLDGALFKYTFLSGQIGQTAQVKFLSFNVVGHATQSLEDVEPYTIVLAQPGMLPGAITSLTLQSAWTSDSFTVVAAASQNALTYTFRVYLADGTLIHTSNPTPSQSFTYTQSMALEDGHVAREYIVRCTAGNLSGDGPISLQLDVTNPAPPAVTITTRTGSGGSMTVGWSADSSIDHAGYVGYYSETSGFTPASGGSLFYQGANLSGGLSGLTVGQTYYVRVAAYDTWSDDVTGLNFSAEYSFIA